MPKQTKNKAKNTTIKTLTTIKSHKFLSITSIIFVLIIGSFAYNKYLDWDNAKAIDTVHSDIVDLRNSVNKLEGKETVIISRCASPEKFTTSYACNVYLEYKDGSKVGAEFKEKISKHIGHISEVSRPICGFLTDQGYTLLGDGGDIYHCVLSVRPSNKEKAQGVFQRYSQEIFN